MSDNKLTIIYRQTGGQVFSDGIVEHIALECWKRREKCPVITISTSLIITAFRVHVVEGNIPFKDLIFCYEGDVIHMDDRGYIQPPWPEGFDDVNEKLLMRLMLGQAEGEKRRLHNESMAAVMDKENLTVDDVVKVVVTNTLPTIDLTEGWKRIPVVSLIKAIRNEYHTRLVSSKNFFDANEDAFISELCLQDPTFKVYYWSNKQQ